jgi:Family of unknown function (DUF6335)
MARKRARKAKGRNRPSRPKARAARRGAKRSKAGRRAAAAKTQRGKSRLRGKAKSARPARKNARAARPTGGTAKTGLPRRSREAAKAGPGITRRAPALERERKQLREIEEGIPSPPSSLNMDRHGSAARTGRAVMRQAKQEHTQTSPAMTGGDVDADWEDAYAVGDEAPGGDNPTPDQDRVDDIGRALGVEYQDNEELKGADKISNRDKHRWELDPASSEDYTDRD